ncbi:MAG: hypothetical protein RR582_06165 [Niameybacter sp.]
MRGLKIKENVTCGTLSVIQLETQDELAEFPITDLSVFFKWLKNYETGLNYISIPMRECYAEMICILRPQTLIVLEPDTVYEAFKLMFGTDAYAYMEETAATFFTANKNDMSWDMPSFFKLFYSANSRKEALTIYNHWQEVIPLNNSSFCQVLEVFEQHLDEILNYFSLMEATHKEEVAEIFS